ncbi:hypothetical protein GEMRC1_009718 [Eukaryota sp. GEM-RC1]
MISHSCIVCKAAVFDGIAVCCDRVVCSQKCHQQWHKSYCSCDSCNATPSSLNSTHNLASESVSSSLGCKNIYDPKHIHFQQTLLALISSHLVVSLWKSEIARDLSLRRLTNILPAFFHHVGYVSQRFLESAYLGVKLFLIQTLSLLQLLIFLFFFPSRLTSKQIFSLCY